MHCNESGGGGDGMGGVGVGERVDEESLRTTRTMRTTTRACRGEGRREKGREVSMEVVVVGVES